MKIVNAKLIGYEVDSGIEMARMSCEKATKQEIRLVVEYPKTPRERCKKCCNAVGTPFLWIMTNLIRICGACLKYLCGPCLKHLCIALLVVTALAIIVSYAWILIILGRCQDSPRLELKDVNVHAMSVYHNNTFPGTLYQADSDISVQLKARNPNTVAGCFTTIRRVAVSVDFKGQRLLHQVVPLEGFGLKPRESRTMTLELKGENAQLKNEIGSLLSLEVRNNSNITLTLSFAARWIQNDRKAAWESIDCATITKAPPISSGGLVYRFCTSP